MRLRRFAGVLVALVALAGCEGVDFGAALPFAGPAKGPGARTLIIQNGSLRVRGPDGYCIDQRTSRPGDGFVVMAGCALVSETQIMPTSVGVLTLQAGAPGSAGVTGAEPALTAILQTAQGRALLSAKGDAATIRDVQVSGRPGVVIVQFSDIGPALVQGLQDREWRAFVDLRGRLVTIALRAPEQTPLTATEGTALLQQAVAALREANAPQT